MSNGCREFLHLNTSGRIQPYLPSDVRRLIWTWSKKCDCDGFGLVTQNESITLCSCVAFHRTVGLDYF